MWTTGYCKMEVLYRELKHGKDMHLKQSHGKPKEMKH